LKPALQPYVWSVVHPFPDSLVVLNFEKSASILTYLGHLMLFHSTKIVKTFNWQFVSSVIWCQGNWVQISIAIDKMLFNTVQTFIFRYMLFFQIIFGPMFSGKTTELIRRLKRYQIAKYKCLIMKYANDDRYSETDVVSHDHQSLAAVSARKIAEFRHKALEFDVVGIDEGQFVSSSTDLYYKI